ncbi:hypothetical protein Gpo141_00000979 [Globisporangium polare]
MAICPPKCAANMEQRLAALRRDQEIDGLRVYLIKYNLFPRNRDPHNSPIRIEELKELVKHWKLHRQRGFWRDHPDKDDLVRALLQHIRSEAASKKRRQEAQEKYRSKALNGGDAESSGAKLRDFTMIFGSSSSAQQQQEDGGDCDLESGGEDKRLSKASKKKTKNCGGDLFYQRGDYDEGMIYLSRIDRGKFRSEEHNPRIELLTTCASAPMPLDQLVRMGNDTGGNSNNASAAGNASLTSVEKEKARSSSTLLYHTLDLSITSNNSMSANALTKDMKLKSVEGFYSISCHKDTEMQLIREGALATIVGVLKMDDIAIRLFSAATLLNLTATTPPPAQAHRSSSGNISALSLAGKEVYAKMIDDGVISALLELSHTPNATVKALCARALFRFTVDETHHFRMVHEGSVVALTQLMTSVPSEDVREACMNGLVNLAGVPRAVTCDSILNTLLTLAKTGKSELLTACGRALLNLSILPTTRSTMVEEGAITALGVLAGNKQLVLFETVSCVLCNLAAIKTNQELLVKNGALAIVTDLLDGVTMAFERVAEDGDEDNDDEDGDGNTTTTKTPTVDLDREEALAAATSLLGHIRKNCTNVLAHLCCNAKLQARVVNAGFVPKLLHILQSMDSLNGTPTQQQPKRLEEETEKFCVIAIANLSLDDRCRPNIVQDGGVPVLLRLLEDSTRQDVNAMLLKLDCVTALSNLMLHPKNFKRMVEEGVVPAFIASISDSAAGSPEIQKACVYAMLSLARDPGMKTRLAEATTDKGHGAIPTMLVFASKNQKHAELCGVCINFLHHLSTRPENYNVLYFEGAVGLLVRVLQKPSASEPAHVIYSLWFNCMTTLANLASHLEKRATLISDGVVEAIQHFLSASASDSRRRDTRTDTKIVRTQFAAAQILFKLHELCCSTKDEVPAFFASLLLLATQSALKNSRLEKKAVTVQQLTASRCALTIAKVSLSARGLRLLAGNTDIPPALNTIMRTGLHEAQVCAAIALCNLATERGHLKLRLWKDSTTDDFIVITLLRVNSEATKAICAKALFNLLTHEDTRDEMVKEGVLYALIKLARLDNEEIRDLSLRSIYNISLSPMKAQQLLEIEIVRILTKMYQAEFSKEIKRLMCGILSNLSSSVPGGGHEQRILQEGALGVLKNLAKVRDPETKVYAANILFNLSCCLEVAELLVRDEANVLSILVTQLKSENKDVKRYGAATIANLSASAVAVQLMTDEALVVVLNDAMKKTMAACVLTTASCVFALRNLFSLVSNQKKFIECNGVPTLAAILASPEMESEAQTLRVSTDMLCALANLDIGSAGAKGVNGDGSGDQQLEERLVRDGIVRALLAIVKGFESNGGASSSADERAMSMNIITSLSNLSKNAKCHEGMLRDGALEAIAILCKTNPGDPRTPFKGLVGVRGEEFCYHCTVALRNLSRLEPSEAPAPPLSSVPGASVPVGTQAGASDVKSQRIGSQNGLVQIVLMLAQTTSPETREHVIVTLHNLALNRRCRTQLIKHDGVKVLLRLGTAATTPTKRHICALALQSLAKTDVADDPHVANIIQEGIVSAIAALADQHQHDILAGAASYVSAIVVAKVNFGSASNGQQQQRDKAISSLNKSDAQSIPQKGVPPDWAKVNICSLTPWPEIVKLDESASQQPEGDKDTNDDSHSDASDSDENDEQAGDAGADDLLNRRKSSPSKKSAVNSPKIGVRVAVKTSSSSSRSMTTAAPRVCNADVVLGSLEVLVDPVMEKVKVNVEAELAMRRSAVAANSSGTSGDNELPKLRPATAPTDEPELIESSSNNKPRKRSTLTQVRHEATTQAGHQLSHSITSSSSPVSSPLKSPATPKRRSRILEPLAIPPSSRSSTGS